MRPIRAALVILVLTVPVATGCNPSADRSSTGSCDRGALAVVKTFIDAVVSSNAPVYERCERRGALLPASLIQSLAAGTWLLDEAAVTDQHGPLPANAVAVRVPSPPQDAGPLRPAHATGVTVIATMESDGQYYVADAIFYVSA